MRVLLDAAHAADVWVLGAIEDRLLSEGASTLWLSRPAKEGVVELIEERGRPHVAGPRAGDTTTRLVVELLRRDWRAWRTVRAFRPDVIVTRSPSGVHAARMARVPVLYDTDDGDAAGASYRVAGPLADIVSSPSALTHSLGRHHRRYRGYKELCYLHPRRFFPDSSVRAELGLRSDERLALLRLTAFTAGHDRSEAGLRRELVDRLLERLDSSWRVVVSSEAPVGGSLERHRLTTPVDRFHHVVAGADLVVGDSQTVCSEAAVLGTPSIRYNSWVGRHAYQVELEDRWGLTRAFGLDDDEAFLAAVAEVVADPGGHRAAHDERRRRMLEWCADPVDDLTRWVDELARGVEPTP